MAIGRKRQKFEETVSWFFFFFFFFCLFRAVPTAYGGSQARGQIGTIALAYATATAMLDQSCSRRSHSNMGFKPHLQPTPQLMATLDA